VHHFPRSYRVLLWAIVLSALLSVAWQDAPPLSITASCSPEAPASGEILTCTFTVSNSSDGDLEAVVVRVPVPEGTAYQQAGAPSGNWTAEEPGAEGVVVYRAQVALGPEAAEELVLALQIEAASGTAIVLAGYSAEAEGLASPVEGTPVTVWAGGTPTPDVETAPTPSPEPTATVQPSPSPTAQPSPTPSPSPTLEPSPSPTPTPTPTITVVVGEIPTMPPPTATPNLTSEQVRVGTITVSIFTGLVVAVVIASVVWVFRASGNRTPDAEE
jgi:uncharacterized repeat protein (TIGR01451 family)